MPVRALDVDNNTYVSIESSLNWDGRDWNDGP